MIFQELKKVFRPKYCLIALAILMVLCARVPRQQAAAVKYARTDAYPERFFIYDGYSVDILFQDFLLQTYGKTVMSDAVPDLEQRREALLTQIQASAYQDPVLQRCGTFFDRETAQFCGTNPDQSLSEEDQIYLFSCINGQLRLDGTDYPVGFLSAMDSVLEQLRQNGSYQVLGSDLLSLLRRNLGIVTAFSLAGLALVIPYGVSEARSGMVRLAYTTKRGRRSYTDKLLTIFVTGVGITFLGVLLAILLFSGLGVRRFWDCRILDAMAALKEQAVPSYAGMTFLGYYAFQLLSLFLVNSAAVLLAGLISLHLRNPVSALACCLPLPAGMWYYRLRYVDILLDQGGTALPATESLFVSLFAVLAALLVTAAARCIQDRKEF